MEEHRLARQWVGDAHEDERAEERREKCSYGEGRGHR